jgi:hypothetical protein
MVVCMGRVGGANGGIALPRHGLASIGHSRLSDWPASRGRNGIFGSVLWCRY